MRYVLLAILFFSVHLIYGQSGEIDLEQLAEIYIEENEDAGDFTEVYEWMHSLYEHKINLNKASVEELISLPFFSTISVSEIIAHKRKFGNFISIYELQVLPSFDMDLIRKIVPFLTVKEKKVTIKELLVDNKQDVFVRYQDNVEKSKGQENGAFKGTLGKSYLRYQSTMGKTVSMGFVLENDAYEPFLTEENTVDYFSIHFQLKNYGKIKNLCLGDYQANFGQGLVMGAGFGGYKSYEATAIGGVYQGIKKYSSVNENLFLRGAAITLKLANFEFTPMVSYNKVDATIRNIVDSLDSEEFFFQSTQTSGFHRTESEINGKNSLGKLDFGGNISWRFGKLKIGATAMHTKFSKIKVPGDKLYQAMDLQGREFTSMGFHYNYLLKNILFSGELAMQNKDKFATVHKALMSLSNSTDVLLIYRNYAPGYFAVNAKAFGEKVTVSNEKGIYFGISSALNYSWTVSMYADYYTFPWLRFGVSAPSKGKDFIWKLNRKFSKKSKIYLRLKWEQYEKNSRDETSLSYLSTIHQYKARVHFDYAISSKIKGASRVEYSAFEEESTLEKSEGFLFYQEFKMDLSRRVKLGIRGTVYNTDDYNTRIYTYEQNVLYNFSIPAFYDKGFRTYLFIGFKPNYWISLQGKIGRTSYVEKTDFGSGNDLIDKPHKTTFTLQAKFRI